MNDTCSLFHFISYQNVFIPEFKGSEKECLTNPKGIDYMGRTAQTKDGLSCQRWDQQKPHAHLFNFFMGRNASAHENYCRNPDDSSLPWCYTNDTNVPRQDCIVPICREYFSFSFFFVRFNILHIILVVIEFLVACLHRNSCFIMCATSLETDEMAKIPKSNQSRNLISL
jgi:hypothetical protein